MRPGAENYHEGKAPESHCGWKMTFLLGRVLAYFQVRTPSFQGG